LKKLEGSKNYTVQIKENKAQVMLYLNIG